MSTRERAHLAQRKVCVLEGQSRVLQIHIFKQRIFSGPGESRHNPRPTAVNQRYRSSQPAQHGEPLLSIYQGIRHYHSTFTGADTERYTLALERKT